MTDLGPCCAHLRVEYLTSTSEGLTRGWWACTDCSQVFTPLSQPGELDNSKVICPNCCNQFGAISVNDQKLRRIAADTIEGQRELLKLVQSDAGNWLHSGLQDRIEAAVGPPGPYRALDDDGTASPDRTPLERVFSESPATPIIEDALKRLSGD